MYLSYIEGFLTALTPASRAQEFANAVTLAETWIVRQQAWVKQADQAEKSADVGAAVEAPEARIFVGKVELCCG